MDTEYINDEHKTPVDINCRECGGIRPHKEKDIEDKIDDQRDLIIRNRVLICKCGTAILKSVKIPQSLDEDKIAPNYFPDVKSWHKKPMPNINDAIPPDIYSEYQSAIKCYNDNLNRACFIYIICTIELICNNRINNLESLKTVSIDKPVSSKVEHLARRDDTRNRSTNFKEIVKGFESYYRESFQVSQTVLETNIKMLEYYLQQQYVLKKMFETAVQDISSLFPNVDLKPNTKRR